MIKISLQLIKNVYLINKYICDIFKRWDDYINYYNVGKLIIEAQGGEERAKYGDNLIKEYFKKLIIEVGKKYNYKTLFKIRKFYLMSKKVATMSRQLTWSHYVELLKFDDINEIKYYINISIDQRLGVRELRDRIRNKEYQRLPLNTK